MVNGTQALKATGRSILSAGVIASYGAKYGLKFTSGVAKQFFGGAKNMADQFTPGMNFGIGEFIYDQGEKLSQWTIDKAVSLQKKLKGMIR